MSEHKNIYAALAAAQGVMGSPVKGSVNPAFRSKYADLADVVTAVAPALSEHGIAFFHYISRDDFGRYMVTALVHGDSDTRIECPVELLISKPDMHGYKSATTYAKRIGLESVTGVAPEDDDGNAAAKHPQPKSRTISRSDDLSDAHVTEPSNPAQAASQGLRDAWMDGIKDAMPFDATDLSVLHPAQRIQFWAAVADALIQAFDRLKSAKGVSAQWDKRDDLIMEMQEVAPTHYQRTLDAFNERMRSFNIGEEMVATGTFGG